ncbi:MAG: ABC transporter ATP-binding protein [Dehalococcoidia bacterium]|nr:ABC transporter ATP-binding protein [Dehalococcoidia bacterium]MCB9486392.1 ABC transporter ATP-binding protein [Thermoflexaceae bacterium]
MDEKHEQTGLIRLLGVEKVYRTGTVEFAALRHIDLTIHHGEMVSIVGPSGSGKSTILNVITGIDRVTAGQVSVDGNRIDLMSEEQLAAWRGRNLGIVFQFFQLLPTLTALENVVLPMEFARFSKGQERIDRGSRNLDLVGLGDKLNHLPGELSGGEQQRVAIARALACEPSILVGDEPTGNLDSESAGRMLDLFVSLNQSGMTVIFVTHDRQLANRASRTISIRDGRVESETSR